MNERRTSFEKSRVFGHENLGRVVEVGSGVKSIKKGDWVCLWPRRFCLTCNPGNAGAACGFAGMGP
jgi:glutathione-independent formaldehyde dehydrogenase